MKNYTFKSLKSLLILFGVLMLNSNAAWADWYISGWESLTGHNWGTNDDCKFVSNTVTFSDKAAAAYQFKLTDGSDWYGHDNFTGAYGAASRTSSSGWGNAELTTTWKSDITFTYDGNGSHNYSAYAVPVLYIAGNGTADSNGNWCDGKNWNPDSHLLSKTATAGKYTVTFEDVAAGDYQFKITDGTWSYILDQSKMSNSSPTNVTLTSSGNPDYNICFSLSGTADVTVLVDITSGSAVSGWKVYVTVSYSGLSVEASDSHGSPTISATSVNLGGNVTVNAVPNTGYHLAEWSSDDGSFGSTTAASTTFTPTANDAVATATYAINQRIVRFNNNGGTGSMSNQTYSYGVAQNLTTNTFTKTGYTFAGWATASDGDAVYANSYNLTLNPTVGEHGTYLDLYAKWTENDYTVTVNAGSHGSVASASVTGHVDTKVTLPTATPDPGYYFTGWTTTSGSVTYTNQSSASAAQVNGLTAAATVQANFSPIWRIACSSDSHNTENHQITNITTSAGVMTSGYVDITLDANTDYNFKVYNKPTNHWWGKTSTVTKITYANQATAVTLSENTGNNQTFLTAGAGTYRFTWNTSNNQVTVTYPTSYTVTFGEGTGNGTAVTASVESSGAITSGQYAAEGKDVTFDQAPATGYTFAGWYTAASGGSAVTGMGTSDHVLDNIAANANVYAQYTENKSTITISAGTGGTTAQAGNHSLGYVTTLDIDATPSNGYSWNTWTTTGVARLASSADTKSNTAKTDGTDGSTGTIVATFTPNEYDIILDPNGGSGENQTVTATFDAAMPTSLKGGSDPIVAPTRTGYTFDGYTRNDDGTGTKYYTGALASNANLDIYVDETSIYAKWNPNGYTVTLDVDEEHQGTIAGATTSQDVTFDAATTTVPNRPTAANGYALVGYYTASAGAGTKLINGDGTWIASVAGYTDEDKHWIHDGDVTLYAYYKQAQITTITFDGGSAVIAPSTSATVTATIDPIPTGDYIVCWRILYSNDNPLDPQPTFTPGSGASVSFTTSETSGIYKVEAKLQTGTTCGGTVLSTETANFQVAGSHTVSILYKDASGNTLQPYSTTTGYPLEWTSITAPTIFGYDFTRWDAGDGITLSEDGEEPSGSSTAGTAAIYFQAIYDGSLTAVYTQRNLIYFKNTLGWGEVYVNFYDGSYWSSSEGSGNNGLTHGNIEMTQIEGTDIWYYDYQSASITPSLYVSFTSSSQANAEHFWGSGDGVNVVYPANYADDINTDKSSENGFKAATPMFIPLAGQTAVVKNSKNSGKANYYNNGYWTTYTPGTGYTLEMYNDEDDTDPIKVLSFTSANDLMPMQIITDLEANKTYRFQVRRGGTETAGIYYGNVNTMTYANHGAGIGWEMSNTMEPFKMAKITTTATGEYTFNLSYSANEYNAYRLRMRVDYPIADGDYQLVYTDAVQTKAIKSAIVNKVAGGKDTVSFFIRKASSPVLRIQKASVNASTGAITWAEYPNPASATNQLTSAILSGLPKDSVYNICLTMAAADGAISVENVEGYSGYYYIRTDAANSKWDNYRASDHMMTYSEYSEHNSTFTHYFTHYVTNGMNVKFVIANDYAPNISDTLAQQTSDVTYSHVNAEGFIQDNANVRFMWDIRDNTVSRAYLAAAKDDGTEFLVLRGNSDTDLMDQNGYPLRQDADEEDPGYNHEAPDDCIQFVDDENWIYETTVKVKPSAYVKLYAKFHNEYIYFRGLNNNTFDEDNAIQLIAGDGDEVQVRIIYDFKTDRIISALIPSGEITEERAIHADVMFIREGQGDIGQLWFSGDGELSEINTAYGIMRLNKYTLNNKDKSTHDPLASPASIYERSLYFISFPFKVKLNEAFGIGTYGKDWIIQRYRGDLRAERGFWAEDDGFWEYIWDRRNVVLEPNVGYLLQIELGNFGESTSDFWANGVENVELFFPSSGAMPNITKASVTHTLPAHECTINRMGEVHNGVPLGSAYDRRIVDSHWNVMSVPTYINTASATFSDDWITTGDGKLGPKFFYEWNKDDNTLTARTATGYTFHAMYAYMVQYKGDVTWAASSGSPYTIVARKTYEEAPKELEFRIELQQNDRMVDQTFISLSNDEEVTSGFEFGYDLSKEKSSRKANIYTLIGYVPAAGNSLPLSEQTTVVPVGVQIPADGDYTFAIPDGTSGIGVTLIDTETGIRTSLSALDYTIQLNAGTYESRFLIEISPVQNTPTGIEEVQSDSVQSTKAHKMLIDNLLYIVKDGKMYDARGARVE